MSSTQNQRNFIWPITRNASQRNKVTKLQAETLTSAKGEKICHLRKIARNSLTPPPTPRAAVHFSFFFRCEFSYSRLRYLSTTFGKGFCSEKKSSTKLFARVKRVNESYNSHLRCALVKFRPLLTLNLLGQFSRGSRYNPYTW